MDETLKMDLESSGPKVQYDENAKLLLSHKIILAHILANVAPEFLGLQPKEIVPLIEGQPDVSVIPVNPGETNAEERTAPVITGVNAESKIPREGVVTYDVRFYVWVPNRERKIKIIVDVEAQKSVPSSYDIVARGIFYNARQISAQLGREFTVPYYSEIKKVYSIWICMNVPKSMENTAIEYAIKPRNLIGKVTNFGQYDLENVVILNLSKEVVQATDELHLHRLLGTLLSPEMKPEKKVEILTQEYDVEMTEDIERRLNIMCNLSQAIIEEGIEKGMEQVVTEMILDDQPTDKIIKYTKVSEDFVEALREKLCAKV